MPTNETTAANESPVDSTPNTQAQDESTSKNQSEQKPAEMTIEDYKSALEKARKEAAKYRTERNELRPLADKAREAEEAGKSELQKAQEQIAALQAESRPALSQQHALRLRQSTVCLSNSSLGTTQRQWKHLLLRWSRLWRRSWQNRLNHTCRMCLQ